jgi:hypothetical protein
MSQILTFQLNQSPDHKGRKIEDIWGFTGFWLEHDHQYIQWLFPIDSQTKFNRHAPILTQEDQEAFRQNPLLKEAQQCSLDVMLKFFGMKRFNDQIMPGDNLNIRDHIWLKHGGHNHLRISRIIRSLALCDQLNSAKMFQQVMLETAMSHGQVEQKTINFWNDAIRL